MKLLQISLFFLAITFFSCGVKMTKSDSKPVNHAIFDNLLQKYVSLEGNVNYKGFIQDNVFAKLKIENEELKINIKNNSF